MSVTPNPYGASTQSESSFSCLLSEPDTDKLNDVTTRRLVKRGTKDNLNTFDLPEGATYSDDPELNKITAHLPANKEAQGVFYCEASNNQGVATKVPVTNMASNSKSI